MATRVGGDTPLVPPAGVAGDNRLDQQREQYLKQLQEQQVVHSRDEAERVVDHVIRRLQGAQGAAPPASAGAKGTPDGRAASAPPAPPASPAAAPGPAPSSVRDLPKLLADFQRQNGLPVTGRLDSATVTSMKDTGVIAPSSSTAGAPSSSSTPASSSASSSAGTPSSASLKAPARAEDTAAARQARSAADQQARARVDGGSRKDLQARSTPSRDAGVEARLREGLKPLERAERVVDPSRLLASLVTAGFAGKKTGLEEGLKSLQATLGLPISGKLDAATAEALAHHGMIESDTPTKTQSDKPVEPKQQVRRALHEPTSTKTAADKDVSRDPLRPQAPTPRVTTSSEVAARAPVSAANDAKEQARVDSVLAQQHAAERGVSEGAGDPAATAGHGEVHGAGAGQHGAGGASGGGDMPASAPASTTASAGRPADAAGPAGEESAVGNAKAGDDVFGDDDRGQTNVKSDDDGDGPGHWRVPLLSEQVHAALEKIARDDDGSGPVSYTWDITFHRPGVYAPGQPAEEIWHVVVHQATAFDPVWQTAADAIASRMLYAEPDAQAPTLEDFIMALRRARVREAPPPSTTSS